MQDINVIVVTARLTRDPQVRFTGGGTAVCELGLAVNNRVKRGERWEDSPCFVDCTIFGKQAEFAGEHLRKGSSVTVRGALFMDSWEDKQSGQKRTKLKIGDAFVQSSAKPEGGQRRSDSPPEDEAAF